ncbi:MAG: glycosyltransferase family 2 protein [Bacilli bacterium]
MIYLVIAVLGLVFGILLFFKTPYVPIINPKQALPTLSIIIPARNEAKNIGQLLSLITSEKPVFTEIIVVDDDSTDDTFLIASNYPVKVLRAIDKPKDWLGKTWACFLGAQNAIGEQLLFLDADVRITSKEINKLLCASTVCPIFSVGPYHYTKKFHEQFSFYFNAVGLAANGFMLPFSYKKVGMFGPAIMIPKSVYFEIGGHEQVKSSIIEDVAFGKNLVKHHYDYQLYLGTSELSYQMYAHRFSDLYHGWIKNFASGALKTSLLMLVFTIIWVSVGFAVLIHIPLSFINQEWLLFIGWSMVLIGYLGELIIIANKIGKFKWYTIALYPLFLLFFFLIFIISLVYKLFNLPVKWKDRKIKSR